MKFALTSAVALAVASSMVAAADLQERQAPPGVDLNSIVANPSAALAQVQSLLGNPTYSSAIRDVVTQEAYISQISSVYYEQLGSESGSQAYASYNSLINSLFDVSPTNTGGAAGSTPTNTGGSSGGSGSSGAGNGASSAYAVGAMGTAMAVGAAAVVAML